MAKNDNTKNDVLACEPMVIIAIDSFNASTDWRGALSAGNSSYRLHGTYDAPASGRRLRRILERRAKKAGKHHGF